ncbi:MAG: ATP-dependent RecD-like DNA helicase [Clostridia bacterium]|nr:ATP-dependent RecD-like DNA helicase [Clostridia bacterium]
MELKGQVGEFIYQNEVNGYSICEFYINDEELITAVGYLPFINVGDTLKITGNYVVHKEYGEQFKIETFEKCMPETLDGLERYLAGGVIKGVGPATAKKIVSTFGKETLEILRENPNRLCQIKGITYERAEDIVAEFNEKWELWQIVGFLEQFGISASSCKKVYDELGTNAVEKIKENPYILVDITYGVDFKKIDKMALEIGIDINSSSRIGSAIKYALNLIGNNGHTCALKENLIVFVMDLTGVSKESVEEAIINLKAKKQIVEEIREEYTWMYLYTAYTAEENIAEKLLRLQKSKNTKKIQNIKAEILKQEKALDIILSEEQKEAIELVNDNNVCIITGGPGTGKTTIIKNIIEIYKAQNKKAVLCAPTGRAAKRMQETTGEEAKTIHRLLEIGKLEEDRNMIEYDVAPIDADIIIIDEMSMVDVYIMNYLMKAIYLGTKLILVGDENQLPSVGPGSVLKDIIASEKIPTVSLKKIFRQAAKSQIVVNAHNVNNGTTFIGREKSEEEQEDFFYINNPIQESILETVISLSTGRLKKYGNYDFFENIQVLTPTKKGMLGTKELNKKLQSALNPESDLKNEKAYGETMYREGDRVMQIKNNYDIYWEKNAEKYETGVGIFNGEIGKIVEINHKEKYVKIEFDDEKQAMYSYSELDQIEHAYAITIHKSQGSEFDVVILVLPKAYQMLLTRNLLYTALTRAKKLLIVIGGKDTVNFMVQNADIKERNTGLEYKLRNNLMNNF